jgi:DNA-binding NarL/FixJ family response regulator
MSSQIKVLIADDHQMMRAGLRALLEQRPDVKVIAEAGDGRAAVRLAREHSPDVVVMDINMPDLNGVEATRQICADGKGPKIIALTGYAPTRFTVEMLNAGASAYVLKTAAATELTMALDAVCAGKIYLSPEVSNEVMQKPSPDANAKRSVFHHLSSREREVLQLLAEGKSTKEVAARLNVSIKTVETHRRNLMEKLNIHSVAELTKYAIREGITSAEF